MNSELMPAPLDLQIIGDHDPRIHHGFGYGHYGHFGHYGGRPWGWGYGRPWGYGAPFLGGFLGGLATGALLSPYGYGFGYPYYGYPYGGFWY